MAVPRKKRPRKAKTQKTPTKNEYEIWSESSDTMAKLVADQANRFRDLLVDYKPLKPSYTIGEFVLDQLKNSNKLIESYLKAARSK